MVCVLYIHGVDDVMLLHWYVEACGSLIMFYLENMILTHDCMMSGSCSNEIYIDMYDDWMLFHGIHSRDWRAKSF